MLNCNKDLGINSAKLYCGLEPTNTFTLYAETSCGNLKF